MKINTAKGKTGRVLFSRTENRQGEVYIGENKMNQTENYTHLGVNVGPRNLHEVKLITE